MGDDCQKIREAVTNLKKMYNFRGPLHFTDFSNLNSIISIGYLCGRNLCHANHIEFYDAAHEEKIKDVPGKVRGCARFYFTEKANYEVMQKLDIPVYLLFDEEIICHDLAIYTDGNADLKYTSYGTDHNFFNYDIDWEAVFDKRCVDKFLKVKVNELFCTRKQAELLIDEPVSLRRLKNIIFRSPAEYRRACNLFGKNNMYRVEPDMFFHDSNYVKDYNIVYNSQSDSNVFIFHFCTCNPVKNDDRHEYRLYDINDRPLRAVKVNYLGTDKTDFHVEVDCLPCLPVKFKFWFYGVLCIEEIIG